MFPPCSCAVFLFGLWVFLFLFTGGRAMSLFSYAGKCRELSREYAALLSTEDIEALRSDCAKIGYGGFWQWIGEHEDELFRLLKASPSRRLRLRFLRDPTALRRLTLAAAIHANRAASLLEHADRLQFLVGCSYREMVVEAGCLFLHIFQDAGGRWPLGGDDPFS